MEEFYSFLAQVITGAFSALVTAAMMRLRLEVLTARVDKIQAEHEGCPACRKTSL